MKGVQLQGNGLSSHHTGTVWLSTRLLLALFFLIFVASPHLALAAESGQPKNVLVLYGFSEQGLFDPLDCLKSAIRSRVNVPVNFYVHYMEAHGFQDPTYERSLSEILSLEHSDLKLDLVIVASYPALRFAVTYRDKMFPGVPVLFCYVHDGRLEGKQLWPGVTGVTISVGFRDTLELSFRLHPGTQNFAVVTGTSEFERYSLEAIHNEFRPYAGKVKLIEIVGLRNDDILKQVAMLPVDTVVLFQLMPWDSTQPEVGVFDTMAAISQHLPTYCIFSNFCIDHGGIGGSYADYSEQSLKTAEIAARLLSGEKPENIPVAHGSATRPYVDWRQLHRWNIPESALPPAATVLYRQPTVWERYKWRIVAVISLCVFQALLIGWLLIQRSRRLQAEEAKSKLAAIVESSEDAILSKTLEGTITSWNAGAEKIYGYSASEMVGQHISILAPADRKEEVPRILERIRRGEIVDHLETVRLTKDGRRIDVSLTISPIKDEHGMTIGASTIARDITDRKRAEQVLCESEERFHTMADTAPVMVWISGPDTLCTFFNRQWLNFTGRTMAQELGNGWAEGVHPADYQGCLDVYHSAFGARRDFTMEYRLRRADGQYRWVVDTGVPRLLPNGDLAGYIGTCLDITDRKRDEQALQELTGRLLMLQDEERQRVAAELHDGLGQSLAIIKNRALMGLGDQTNQDQAIEQLEEISVMATSAILEVREIAHNLRPYELDRLGLVVAIESMIERVSDSTSINLSTDLERIDGLLSPEAETSVYRIVQEGLNNVLKHSHATAARVEIKKNGKQLAISVQDNGKGMPPPAPAEKGNGARGFGLAGIAERVRLLGGSFAIDSQPTRGTTLAIRLELPVGTRE